MTIQHDVNGDGEIAPFPPELLTPVAVQISEDPEIWQISVEISSFSKFAIGGVKALALGGLSGSISNPIWSIVSLTSVANPDTGFGGDVTEINLNDLEEPQVLAIGEQLLFQAELYENQGINYVDHVSMHINNVNDEMLDNELSSTSTTQDDYDTSITYERFSTPELSVVDPNGLLSVAEVSFVEVNATNFIVEFLVTFEKPMDISHIYLQTWDLDTNPDYKEIQNIITIVDPTESLDWIKNIADWWSQGIISDAEFIEAVQFLINEGVISVSETTIEGDSLEEIPSWIKQTAGWWAEGIISDDEFLNAIGFLVNNGIILVV